MSPRATLLPPALRTHLRWLSASPYVRGCPRLPLHRIRTKPPLRASSTTAALPHSRDPHLGCLSRAPRDSAFPMICGAMRAARETLAARCGVALVCVETL